MLFSMANLRTDTTLYFIAKNKTISSMIPSAILSENSTYKVGESRYNFLFNNSKSEFIITNSPSNKNL
jgi:hypothetical protein